MAENVEKVQLAAEKKVKGRGKQKRKRLNAKSRVRDDGDNSYTHTEPDNWNSDLNDNQSDEQFYVECEDAPHIPSWYPTIQTATK